MRKKLIVAIALLASPIVILAAAIIVLVTVAGAPSQQTDLLGSLCGTAPFQPSINYQPSCDDRSSLADSPQWQTARLLADGGTIAMGIVVLDLAVLAVWTLVTTGSERLRTGRWVLIAGAVIFILFVLLDWNMRLRMQ